MNASRVATRLVALAACLVAFGTGDARADRCKNHYILDCAWGVVGAAWLPAGTMKAARRLHTATLLNDGTVLVAGGAGSNVEVHDPVDGSWHAAEPLSRPRVGHTATLLADGRVLVTGGDTVGDPPNFGRTESAEIYDPATGTWSDAGRMTTPRSGHSATLLGDGRVLLAGGFVLDTLRSAEIYDPATNTFTATGGLVVGRYWHTATLLADGRVLALRGSNDGDLMSTLATAEIFDPATGTWTLVPSSSVGSVFHTATRLPDGRVLVTGGYTGGVGGGLTLAVAEVFDPLTQSWTRMPQLREARYQHSATLLPHGRVLIAGGQATRSRYPTLRYVDIASAVVLDIASGQWIDAPALLAPRAGHSATLLTDGRVLVAGGAVIDAQYATSVLAEAQYYLETARPKRPKEPAGS